MSISADRIEWRNATREEVRYYYREEFPERIKALPEWITPTGPVEYAVALDKRYPIVQSGGREENKNRTRKFIRRSTQAENGKPIIEDWNTILDLFTSPAYNDPQRTHGNSAVGALIDPDTASADQFKEGEVLSPPITRAAYYSLDHHDRSWVLMFDIDGKDIAKIAHENTGGEFANGDLPDDSRITTEHPEGFPYQYEHVEAAIDYAFTLSEWLQSKMEFDETQVVYSGQGAHVYGLDEDPYHRYDQESRKRLVKMVSDNLGVPVDEQVTPDKRRVARIPYSLHTDVCRVATPISNRDFDFRIDGIPDFIQEKKIDRDREDKTGQTKRTHGSDD